MELRGAAAIVTGAASGLGAATAAALAARGMRVYGLDLPGPLGAAAAVPGVTLVAGDVTAEEPVRDVLRRIVKDGFPLRAAVNCAGVASSGRVLGSRGVHDLELFRSVVTVNVLGTFNVLRLAAELMARQGPDDSGQAGVIVNTASIAAFEPQRGQIAYAASKAAVVGLTLAAARDLAEHAIRVVTVAPGLVDTPMLAGLGAQARAGLEAGVPFPARLARPAEYARLVITILELDYLNGETIRLDGALRLGPS